MAQAAGPPRRPRGIYAVVNVDENIQKAQAANPSITPAQLESYFINLYQDVLRNPAVSGLALWVRWSALNPNPPASPSAYDWSWVDDVLNQISLWNSQNPTKAPKTVQLVPLPGFQTPQWVMDQIPSCDGLFQSPVQTPPASCGKATFSGFVEGGGVRELPMPWNPVYKSAWRTFLGALAARYQSNAAFVSISVAGPTASSEEMIVPDNANTPAQGQFGGILPNAMWLKLLAFHYTGMPAYQKSDQGFIDEWNAAIDMYGQIFSGVTLVATTGGGLPNLAATGFTVPSIFSAACPNPDMDCAAETTILAYFAQPTVGGNNAKAVQEDGMEAARGSGNFNLGVAAIRVFSATTASLPPPAAQLLGGAQFNSSFAFFTLEEGCTSKFPPNDSDPQVGCSIPAGCTTPECIPVACIPQACLAPSVTQADVASFKTVGNVPAKDLLSPEQAVYNVLEVYFNGTPVASFFGGTPGAAPFNYLQVYAADFQYSEAHASVPAQVVETSGASVAMTAQDQLNLASDKLLEIGEPPLPPSPSLSVHKTWQAGTAGANPERGNAFTYSITVTNNGNAAANGVTVQDTPANAVELTLQGPTTFNLGGLGAGATKTVNITATAGAAGTYTNMASATWLDTTGLSGAASTTTLTTVDRQPGDFAAGLSGPVPLNAGVQQVLADGSTVYVVNNPGDSLTVMDCTAGACSVSSTVSLGAGAQPVAAAKMDVDGDGINDVLVLNQGTGTISVLLSTNPGVPQVSNVGMGAVALSPFNAGDGVPRVAVVFPGAVSILAWDGQQFQPGATVTIGGSPFAVINGDFNRDGADDLLVSDRASGTVQVLLGDGAGGLSLASVVRAGTNAAALAPGDVNNDGALDAVVMTDAGLVAMINDGTANLTPQPVVAVTGTGAVVLADFNGDGNLDAAVANAHGSSVSLYRGDGAGNFSPAGAYLTGKGPSSLAASDLDNDGIADLISGDSGSQDLAILLFSMS